MKRERQLDYIQTARPSTQHASGTSILDELLIGGGGWMGPKTGSVADRLNNPAVRQRVLSHIRTNFNWIGMGE